ncbi:hypothetical protein [Glutamicibacter nicotianae]|uniref:hypothetical protein n=1 Tax=Glutamicibacter nicotianae TaxID=37929 RepID=UPI001956FBFF|nr:hypothetical protein [Glutamicibacter nicotianae]MBM7767369.1 hypothetical protein [Glutamicibacter nicotianae]
MNFFRPRKADSKNPLNLLRKAVGKKPVRYHDRASGPVEIDPDAREIVIVYGKPKKD